jgi:hypothetical protein
MVPETQDVIAQSFQIGGPRAILSALFAMLAAIGLNDQLGSEAHEINYVRFNDQLAPELVAAEPMRPQVLPSRVLGVGHLMSQ